MSNKLTDEMIEQMKLDIIQTLRDVQNEHIQNKKKGKEDKDIMQKKISTLEELYREVSSNFQHFSPNIYHSLDLPHPEKTKSVKTSSESTEEDTESSASNERSPRPQNQTIAPRKKKPQQPLKQPEYYDSEETAHTVNVEMFTDDSMDNASESPRTTEENQPVMKLPETAPAVQQGWAAERSRRQSQQSGPLPPNNTTAAKSTMPVEKIYTMNVIAGANKIHPDKKTVAIVDALISAQQDLRENKISPSAALQTIVDKIGTKKEIKGRTVLVLSRVESNFLKEFMKIPSLQDVIKDRACLAILQNMAQSLPRNKREVILKPLESVKESPAPTIKSRVK